MLKQLSTILLLFLTSFSFAQQAPEKISKKDRVKAIKIEFINQELELTPEEKEKFWPIYNKFRADKKAVLKRKGKKKKIDDMTNNEAEKLIEKNFMKRLQVIELERQMVEDLENFLSFKKIAKLKRADHHFKRKLAKKIRKKKRANH